MTTLDQILAMAIKYPDGKVLFEEPLKIKSTPHQEIFTAHGVWAGPDGVYVLDSLGEWHGPLEERQSNAEYMINSIYQRLKALELKPSVILASHDKEVNATIVE